MQNIKPTRRIAMLAAVVLGVVAIVVVIMSIIKMSQTAPGSVKITLETNGGVPYKWLYEIGDDSVIEYVGVESKDLDPGMDGGSVEETYSFKALKTGETDVVFEYKDITEDGGDAIETKVYHMTVDDKLDISVEEK
ncbi:protease inhibitor I42 family protein [Candidatus Saccharibacteria bacterium]|nr:protease inhibitor I42 family protein [Candidatus Saccharibacteria bacterium]